MKANFPPKRFPRWIWVAAAVAVVAVAALAALRPSARTPVSTAAPARRDLVVSITSDGTLEPPPGGELRAPANAVVREIPVAEGERVTRGTVLVRLGDPELEQSALTARSGAMVLGEERSRAAAEADSARRQMQYLESVFESDRRLIAQAAIPRATFESDELAYRQAQDRLRQAEAHLGSLGGTSPGEGSPSRVRLADEAARELQSRVEALTLRAPTDGIVYGLPRKAGEAVTAGQLVASVTDPDHLRVRARIDQPDLPRIAAGQRMIVTFDGLPDRHWDGRVQSVPGGVTDVGGRQVGEVLGEISDPKLSLPPNASVNIQVIAGEKRGALAIPRAALLRDGGQRYVFVLVSGRAKRRPVTVGLIGLSDVEITSGLSEQDRVLIPGTVPLTDGVRVTAAQPS